MNIEDIIRSLLGWLLDNKQADAEREVKKLIDEAVADVEKRVKLGDEIVRVAQGWHRCEGTLRDVFLAIDALEDSQKDCCDHEWVDARNEVVTSGQVCIKCRAMKAGNEPQKD